MVAITPGAASYALANGTARPWGLAGSHAIVVQDSVVFALDKPMNQLVRGGGRGCDQPGRMAAAGAVGQAQGG